MNAHFDNAELQQLVNTYGSPLYVYHAGIIKDQIDNIKSAFDGMSIKLKYAAKALTNINILKLVKSYGMGCDAVSIEEVHLALFAGFLPHEILYTPNCVAWAEIEEAVSLGVVINLDNISVLERFGSMYGGTVACCIRINPHILAGGNAKISTGHIDSKFGISIMQMRHVGKVVKTYGIDVQGLHVHSGSDFLNADVFLEGAKLIFECAMAFDNLQFIDFGSGFKVAYKDGDVVTDLPDLGKQMKLAFSNFCQEYGRELECWFEPGKYIVSEAGVLLVTTNVIKTTPATVFVGVNSGLNHLIRPMMYDAYHTIENISNANAPKRVYSVVGYICETDTFGYDRLIAEVREGDTLSILNAGAYGYSMASNYNSRLRPAEVLIDTEGQAHLIRKRENFSDLLNNQVILNK